MTLFTNQFSEFNKQELSLQLTHTHKHTQLCRHTASSLCLPVCVCVCVLGHLVTLEKLRPQHSSQEGGCDEYVRATFCCARKL